MRSSRLVFVIVLAIACLVFTVSGQNQEQKQKTAPPVSADDFEKAQQGVLSTEADKAAEASRLTATFAADGGAVTGPIPRKNDIDAQTFGPMERDKLSHAPVANGNQFVI